jgi:LysM repeat protein
MEENKKMSKKFVQVLIVVLALTLSACTRTASSAPAATATPKANFPKPVATSGMNAIEIAGTQTAIATAGLPMPTKAGADAGTGAPAGNPTFTPLAGVNQKPADSTALPSPTTGAAATPVALATAGPVAKPGTYSLHQGEFPYCLARRFNVSPEALLSLNGLSSGQSYYAPGTVITIPQSGGAFPGLRALKPHPAQYVVQAGDTVYSVACEFGDADPMAIVSANGLSGSFALTAGATIQVP